MNATYPNHYLIEVPKIPSPIHIMAAINYWSVCMINLSWSHLACTDANKSNRRLIWLSYGWRDIYANYYIILRWNVFDVHDWSKIPVNIEFVQTSASFIVEKGNLCPLMSLHFHDEQLLNAIINYKHFVVYFIEFGFLWTLWYLHGDWNW